MFFSNSVKANAIVLNFDDIIKGRDLSVWQYSHIDGIWDSDKGTTYGGLDWKNILVGNFDYNKGSEEAKYRGYAKAVISGHFAATNFPFVYSGEESSISSNEPFTFNGAYFGVGVEVNPIYLSITATRNDDLWTETKISKLIYWNEPQYINFDFKNINKLTLTAFYANPPIANISSLFLMDDFTFNEPDSYMPATPVPESSSMLLGLMSVGGMLGLRKRRKIAS